MIFECDQCGHRFVNVQNPKSHVASVYCDKYFSGDPGGYVDYLGEESAQRSSAKHYLKIIERLGNGPGRMLDIGCAAGFHCDEFGRAGWSVEGIEPNPAMARIAADRYGVRIVGNDAQLFQTDSHYDLISMLQVISHLLDPIGTIHRARELLAAKGFLLIETWDRSSWAARVCGTGWHEYNPPSVIHWFTRKNLSTALERNGLTVVASGVPAKRIAIGRGIRMMEHSAGQSFIGRMTLMPLRLVPGNFSVPYFLGDVFWLLCRKK